MENELRFAVLIDADNVSEKYVKIILDETANYGTATTKRIYGDWTSTQMTRWKQVLLENSIIPIQQYSYTTGKNSTDSAMIIDAMDLLYTDRVDGFCIVSSDSDFTRLAARLREAGKKVIGMGESYTPQPFISACDKFKFLDMLYEQKQEEAAEAAAQAEATGKKKASGRPKAKDKAAADAEEKELKKMEKKREQDLNRVRDILRTIFDKYSDDDDWMITSMVGTQLSKRMPEFDVRNYGYKKLSSFLKSLGTCEWEERESSGGQSQLYFRRKD
jgi:uncharacterized protein (TIGR00288 family)